ncbi:MAG: hypothetical protein ACSLFQ_23595 [Thermoanaerobaculia bacterium]
MPFPHSGDRSHRGANAARAVALAATLVLAVALPATAVRPDPPEIPPDAVVSKFYDLCIRERVTGLPTDEQFEAMSDLLSDRILGMLADARMEQADFARENPDEKPPWIEGDLFSSLYEGPTRFTVGTPVIERDRARVTVRFADDQTDDGIPFAWEDDVLLVIDVNNDWRIDEIVYRGTWDFASRGTLSESLPGGQATEPID